MNNSEKARPTIFKWIKTGCGRAKYVDLASRNGITAKLRLGWFCPDCCSKRPSSSKPRLKTSLPQTDQPQKIEVIKEIVYLSIPILMLLGRELNR